MKRSIIVVLLVVIAAAAGHAQTDTAEVRVYLNEERSGLWIICKDSDGHLVWFEFGQNVAAYGMGYERQDLEETYKVRAEYTFGGHVEYSCKQVLGAFEKPSEIMTERVISMRNTLIALYPG